jgi:lipopolysaccharide/colanic/teichoic acid biosynthesis glycosyltransferase
MAKRVYDLLFSTIGLLVLGLPLLAIAAVVKRSDNGPAFYKQQRVGRYGRLFWIWKFRTMVVNADQLGPGVTKDGDPRITRVGRFLRKTKLDELPQLWNVFRGDMSFVGPRPELPRYVERYTEAQREILRLKPGITDLATLQFRNEEALLRKAPDVERFYLEHCVPRKIELNLIYARKAGVLADTWIILQTLFPALQQTHEGERQDPASRAH